jgi:hypothetical protein
MQNSIRLHSFKALRFAVLLALTATWAAAQTPAAPAPPPKPVPSFANVSYGSDPDQIMDIYLPPDGTGPFPVVLWYGGIWKSDKGVPDLGHFFPAHCAVIGVQVRSMTDAQKAKISPPISTVLLDARRAVQFVRLHAADYHLDPNRIATAGGSQGTLPALYVACAGEKADPKSSDPVEQQSTKVVCVGAWRSQPSIDPKVMQEWVPGVKWGAPALGCAFDESLAKRDELLPIIQQWSPDALVNKDTPPIYFGNEWGTTCPPDVLEENWKVHAPLWGLGFKKVAESRGDTSVYNDYPGHPSGVAADIWAFLTQELNAPAK